MGRAPIAVKEGAIHVGDHQAKVVCGGRERGWIWHVHLVRIAKSSCCVIGINTALTMCGRRLQCNGTIGSLYQFRGGARYAYGLGSPACLHRLMVALTAEEPSVLAR